MTTAGAGPTTRGPTTPDDEGDDHTRDRGRHPAPGRHEAPSAAKPSVADPGVAAAVAAGVFITRWWLSRRGTGLAATADLMSATDALGSGASRLGHF